MIPREERLRHAPEFILKPASRDLLTDLRHSYNKATKAVALERMLGGTKVPYI